MSVDNVDVWTCHACADVPELETDKVKEHLTKVHGITDFAGTRSMQMHLDGADFHLTSYEYKIGEVILMRSIKQQRTKPFIGSEGVYRLSDRPRRKLKMQ